MSARSNAQASRRLIRLVPGFAGLVLIGLFAALARLSFQFDYLNKWTDEPVLALVGIGLAAGVVYLAAVAFFVRDPGGRWLLGWMIAVGVALRLLMFVSKPVLEDDFYRYLWDGAVAANGVNPYAFAPKGFAPGQPAPAGAPDRLLGLARESGPIIARVNHAEIRSNYPPVAQLAFVLAYWIKPWSFGAWRLVLLVVDGAAMALLIAVLRALRLPITLSAVYWWNPLLVKEVFNSGHMDVVVLAFVLGAVLLAVRGRNAGAAGILALAVGAKVWPVILAPLILRPLWGNPKRLALGAGVFAALTALLLWPTWAGGSDAQGGLQAYARSWENNDALFRLLVWIVQGILVVVGSHAYWGQYATRAAVCVLLALTVVVILRRPIRDGTDLCRRSLWIVAALFLISPTEFPWYYTWLVPLLAIQPRFSLLAYTALLPLYYMRYYLEGRGRLPFFENGVVWIEHAPVWLLMVREFRIEKSEVRSQKTEGGREKTEDGSRPE